jgi:hypothetical protein
MAPPIGALEREVGVLQVEAYLWLVSFMHGYRGLRAPN